MDECAICLDKDNDDTIRLLICGHAFHGECIDRWAAVRAVCPLCMQPLALAGTITVSHLQYLEHRNTGVLSIPPPGVTRDLLFSIMRLPPPRHTRMFQRLRGLTSGTTLTLTEDR